MALNLKKNFMRILTTVIFVYTVIMVGRNIYSMVHTWVQIHRLNREKAIYVKNIERDSTLLEQLRYDEYLEQYAREHYHLQRPKERVYIINE